MKLLLTELDGTIIRPRNTRNNYVIDVRNIDIPNGRYEKLRYYKVELGFTIVIATQQPLIPKGKRTVDRLFELFYATQHLLGNMFDGFIYCPHDSFSVVDEYKLNCTCKKPRTGMYESILREMGMTPEGIDECIVVGDGAGDPEFAMAIDAKHRLTSDFF
jgi:D-glycero-D-manno-heptose 1,7-bisphosphate phosphatase